MTEIVLPWPPRELHPNSRTDRRTATAKRRAYREAGFYAVKAARAVIPADAELRIVFHAATCRSFDLDNALAALKTALDGMALASGCDDSGWSFRIAKGAPVPGGAVLVEIGEPDGWQHIGGIVEGMIKGVVG